MVASKMSEQVTGQIRQTDKGVEVAAKMTEQGRQTSKRGRLETILFTHRGVQYIV